LIQNANHAVKHLAIFLKGGKKQDLTPKYSKDSLSGGWIYLPKWDSHPFDYTPLPGRTSVVSP